MVQVEEAYIDFDRLKNIFSDNKEIMEQVMLGLILTAHEKAPDLKRYAKNENWDKGCETIAFIKSAYKQISTLDLQNRLDQLDELIQLRKYSIELQLALDEFEIVAAQIIQQIEYYLSEG